MNISTKYVNETTGAVVEVVTDGTDTWIEGAMVFTKEEAEMDREGQKLTGKEANALFAYYHARGHVVRKQP